MSSSEGGAAAGKTKGADDDDDAAAATAAAEGGADADPTPGGDGPPPPVPVPEGHSLIAEGSARMIFPASANAVFYNPVQVQNRDLSVLMISLYAERRLRRAAIERRRKELLDEERKGGAPRRERDADGLERRAAEEMEGVDWTGKAKETSRTSRGIRVLEALAASGLRSVRYWKEIPGVRQVVINDLEEAAVELARKNVAFNGLEADLCTTDRPEQEGYYDGIRVQQSDCTHEMYLSRRPPSLRPSGWSPAQREQRAQYDVVDLDPYGSAAPFLDAAVQSVVHGGMLCVTCTDMAALGGSHPETCYGRYAGMPVPRGEYLQELALRILLCSVATTAAKYGRTIAPVLSVGMAFYVRVFVEVWDDKKGVNDLSLRIGTVYQSTQCPSFHVVPHGTFGRGRRNTYQPSRAPSVPQCRETGGPFKAAGPAWLGPLHSAEVVEEAVTRLELPDGSPRAPVHPLATKTPLHGLLTAVSEELPDVPLYYTLPGLCRTLRCVAPPLRKVKAALVNAGYRASAYHKEPMAVKTDAPTEVVWDVMRAWCREHPPKKEGEGKGGKKRARNEKKESRKERRERRKREREGKGGAGAESENAGRDGGARPAEKKDGKEDGGDDDDDDEAAGGKREVDAGEGAGGDTADADGEERPPTMSPGALILSKQPSIKVDFTIPPGFDQRKKATRYPHNPEKGWGPKPRATGRSALAGTGAGAGAGTGTGTGARAGAGGTKRKAAEEGGVESASGGEGGGPAAAKKERASQEK